MRKTESRGVRNPPRGNVTPKSVKKKLPQK